VLVRALLGTCFLRNQTDHLKPKGCTQLSSVLGFQVVHSREAMPAATQSVTETCKDKRQDYRELLCTCMTEQSFLQSARRRAGWSLHTNRVI